MAHEKGAVPEHIISTPVWMTVIRGFQFFLAIVILGISGWLIHGAYIEEMGFAIAVSVFTWIIVPYVFFTEKMSGLHSLYHIIAVLVLEGWMVIMWLACFASVAARRATFVVPTSVDDCYSDGSLVGSNHCTTFRKRGIILFKGGQAGMSAAAGLGALNWLLFVASFVYLMVMFFRARKQGRFADVLVVNNSSGGQHSPEAGAATTESYQMDPKPHDVAVPPQPQDPYNSQVPHGGYAPHGQAPYSPQQVAPPQSYSPPPAGTYPPYQPSVSPQPTSSSHHGDNSQELYGQPQQYPYQPQTQQHHYNPPVQRTPVARNELPSNHHSTPAPRASSPVRSSSPGYSSNNNNDSSNNYSTSYSNY